MGKRTKERAWLEVELFALIKEAGDMHKDVPGITLDECYGWFDHREAPSWKNAWENPGGQGRLFTYSNGRIKTMIRSALTRLVDHGRLVKFKKRPRKSGEWWATSGSTTPVTFYKAVSLLDALAHASKRTPKRPARFTLA